MVHRQSMKDQQSVRPFLAVCEKNIWNTCIALGLCPVLLILHALTADKDAELVIDSPDADVPILLIKGCQLLRVFSQEEEFEEKYCSSTYL